MSNLKEQFEEMAHNMGMCLDQHWNVWDNPYIDSDTYLAFKIFKDGAKAQELLFDLKEKSLLSKKGEIIGKLHFTESKLREALEEKEKLKKEHDTMEHNIGWLNKMYGALEKESDEIKQKLKKFESGEFVVVPREPTKEMLDAGFSCGYGSSTREPYKAMIEVGEVK